MCSKQTDDISPLVNLQILGVQKAGTTALAHFLGQHPDICVVDGKEAHVFDQPEIETQADKNSFAKTRYRKKLAHYHSERIICDATPITLLNPTFLRHCVDYNKNARFIVILRDPVKRAVSHYNMSKSRGREKRNMLLSFLLEPWRLRIEKQTAYWPRNSPWRECSYLKRGEYNRQLRVLRQLVRQDQVLIISQQALLKQHDATLKNVFAFLGVKPIAVSQENIFSQLPMSPSLLSSLAKLYATFYFLIRR